MSGSFPSATSASPSSLAAAFAEAVDRVATISTEKARAVKLRFEPARMTISAISVDAGRATEEVDVDFAGEPLEIGFNARYILDMMAQIEGLGGPAGDGEARRRRPLSVSPPIRAALYVLMPMRV